jgi:hypothetical protein
MQKEEKSFRALKDEGGDASSSNLGFGVVEGTAV